MTTNNSNIQEMNSGTPPVSPLQILKTYFGYDSFREGQGEIIDTILSGRDALAIMPTGAGKSLCYQVPALLLPGITLVVSPLISLMQDQVKSLNEAGIHAAYINSSLTEGQINKALSFAARGVYKIIYVAPERLETASFLSFALHTPISMVTVDEAHCISQWGQDFRPSYLKIIDFVEQLPGNPIISAFTATATEVVKNDIARILKLKNPNIVVTGFDRENLYYQVEHLTGKQKDIFIQNYIETHPNESGIIYCATRKNVDTLYEKLLKQGVSVTDHSGACITRNNQTVRSRCIRRILLEKMGVDILLECPLNDQIKHMKADVFIRQILKGDLQASCVVVGEDFRFGHERKGSPELLEKYGEKYDYETIVIAKENGWQP